jgi:hypothetical protein
MSAGTAFTTIAGSDFFLLPLLAAEAALSANDGNGFSGTGAGLGGFVSATTLGTHNFSIPSLVRRSSNSSEMVRKLT